LQKLPTSIGQLNALQQLQLSQCLSLQKLPTSIDQLSAFHHELALKGCSSLKILPTSIGQLNALQKLHLWGCSSFARITFIYQSIECTPKFSFIYVFELENITYIYWPIECTPRV